MKKALLFLLLSSSLIAQKTCESKEDTLEDLNSITKCSIESSKKASGKSTRQISVNISAPKRRYLKKRVENKKAIASSVNNIDASGISNTKSQATITNNIALLTNTLSSDEVKKAVKFHEISNIPTFKDCENVKGKDQLGCFNKEMISHIEKHFHYPNEAVINKIEGKVWVRFIIDTDGNISNVKTLGPKGANVLNEEAKRVVSHLPKFIPGNKGGKNVSVKYGFPINFSLDQE